MSGGQNKSSEAGLDTAAKVKDDTAASPADVHERLVTAGYSAQPPRLTDAGYPVPSVELAQSGSAQPVTDAVPTNLQEQQYGGGVRTNLRLYGSIAKAGKALGTQLNSLINSKSEGQVGNHFTKKDGIDQGVCDLLFGAMDKIQHQMEMAHLEQYLNQTLNNPQVASPLQISLSREFEHQPDGNVVPTNVVSVKAPGRKEPYLYRQAVAQAEPY